MPELPEVETITRGLNKKVLNRAFVDVWTDWEKMIHLCSDFRGKIEKKKQAAGEKIKKSANFNRFKKQIKGKKIKRVWRRGKNIILELSGGLSLLVHQKLTGHLLLGKWRKTSSGWVPINPGPLEDPMNRFLHIIFQLDNKQQLALSDLRKFAKVELWNTPELKESEVLKSFGPEVLDNFFTFLKFQKVLEDKNGKIKQVLMNQTVVAGIGNIYSDEILFRARIHPFRETSRLTTSELRRIYQTAKKTLKKAIELRGESISDFRDLDGKKGNFDKIRRVYRREGEPCVRCGSSIKRIKLGGRSAHFCSVCQK